MVKTAFRLVLLLAATAAFAAPPASETPKSCAQPGAYVGSYVPMYIDRNDGCIYECAGNTLRLVACAGSATGSVSNVPNTLVQRGASGQFAAGRIDTTMLAALGPVGPQMLIGKDGFNNFAFDVDGVGNVLGYTNGANLTLSMGSGPGNLVIPGLYNSSHEVIGSTHIWEESAGTLAIKNSAPTGATDGSRFVLSARASVVGPAAWATNGNSCTTACTNIGLANCGQGICISGTGATCTALGVAVACSATDQVRLCRCF